MPPSVMELKNRLFARATDNPARIKMRVEKAIEEMKLAEKFDHTVINDNLQRASDEVFKLVKSFLNS